MTEVSSKLDTVYYWRFITEVDVARAQRGRISEATPRPTAIAAKGGVTLRKLVRVLTGP